MENTIATLTSYIPADVDFLSMLKFIGIFAVAVMAMGLLARLIMGKRSSLNHAVSSAIGIIFVYIITNIIYTYDPWDLTSYLYPLPLAGFNGDTMILMSMSSLGLPAICSQVLSMIILAFLVNLLDSFIPRGKRVINWYLMRFLTVILAIALHAAVSWAFSTYLPGVLVTYAPMILLAILLSMLALGALNVLLGVVLTVANPIIGALYAFFFSNKIGKQISKAVLTTLLLCALVSVLEYLGFTAFSIAAVAPGNYIPLLAALLVLWYLIGHVL